MKYFQNDVESSSVEAFTIENGRGSVSIYGNMTVRPSEEGVRALDRVIERLEEVRRAAQNAIRSGLDVKEEIIPLEVVDNPFN